MCAYSTWPYVLISCSYARRSSAERPAGSRRQGQGGLVHVGRNGRRHVGVDREQILGCLQAHLIDHEGTPVAALGDVAAVAEALHQLRPGAPHALRAPARARGLAGEPVARHRRNHNMEGVVGARAVCRRIGQPIDDLQLLDDRAGPSVIDDERQCVAVLRANVDEVDVEAVDLGDELREGVQLRLTPAPVVLGRPVARELLHRRQRHALRVISDSPLLGPLRGLDTPPEVVEGLVGNVNVERADLGGTRPLLARDRHVAFLPPFRTVPSLIASSASRAREDSGRPPGLLRFPGWRPRGRDENGWQAPGDGRS